jgi:hypothetical protein
MTPDCAVLLSAGMDCACRSIVSLLLACRNRSCVAFTEAPEDCSNVASVRRKECQPICLAMPARVAAGRITLRSRLSGQYGCSPFLSGLPVEQSTRKRCIHRQCLPAGFGLQASHDLVHDSANRPNLCGIKADVRPFQSHQFNGERRCLSQPVSPWASLGPLLRLPCDTFLLEKACAERAKPDTVRIPTFKPIWTQDGPRLMREPLGD